MTCKSRECKNKFTPEAPQQKYCTVKCQRREAYLKTMDTGWRAGIQVFIHKKQCGYRQCNKKFETRDPRRVYCCETHAKKERLEQKKDDRKKGYKSRIKEREVVCQWRGCNKPFKTRSHQVRYCCKEHRNAENRAILYDKRYPDGKPQKTNVSHKALLMEKKKQDRFRIPHFSAQWIQRLYDERMIHDT